MKSEEQVTKPTIALAGASGFVGTHLRLHLSKLFRFRALTRSPNVVEQHGAEGATEWRHCDLYSLSDVRSALQGCTLGIYLVHSMAPSSRLVQGSFEDTDLLLADNFVRAAESAGLKHIIYLSGLMPKSGETLSPHLRSRREVEGVMRSRAIPVTVLRAGLIFGPGGSSFSMLVNLVRRLRFMLLPAWVGSKTQSIDIFNVCQAFEHCLLDEDLRGGTYDLGGHDPMTYRKMILRTGEVLGRPVKTIDVPVNFLSLSKHWVALFGGVPTALVGPLQESLQHDLEASANPLLERLQADLVPFEESLRRGVGEDGAPKPNPRSETQSKDRKDIRRARRVRSVQRMPLPNGWNAAQIAVEYGEWLSRKFGGLINAEKDADGTVRFLAFGNRLTLLELEPISSRQGAVRRCTFQITGGVLSRKVDPVGRFEFRTFPESGCLIASIHGFSPTLPWWIYALTQAVAHLLVMRAFSRHLAAMVAQGTGRAD